MAIAFARISRTLTESVFTSVCHSPNYAPDLILDLDQVEAALDFTTQNGVDIQLLLDSLHFGLGVFLLNEGLCWLLLGAVFTAWRPLNTWTRQTLGRDYQQLHQYAKTAVIRATGVVQTTALITRIYRLPESNFCALLETFGVLQSLRRGLGSESNLLLAYWLLSTLAKIAVAVYIELLPHHERHQWKTYWRGRLQPGLVHG